MAMTFQLTNAAHAYGLDDYMAIASDPTRVLGTPMAIEHSWGAEALPYGAADTVTTYWSNGYDSVVNLVNTGNLTATDAALYYGRDTIWTAHGTAYVDPLAVNAGLDHLDLLGGSDTVTGNAYNNFLEARGGNDLVVGNGGRDTASLQGSIWQHSWSVNANSVTTAGPEGQDTLVGISRMVFDDAGVAFDTRGNAGEAYRLYQAAFNRAPDIGGLGYQIAVLDAGYSLSQVAANFIASPEFQRTYGFLANSQFVTQLYANVLHRAPDAQGLAFHSSHLNAGMQRADVLAQFSESPENQANVIGVIQDGMIYTPY